jgi:type III secretion system FlhB-like substrate exporter
VADLKKVVGLKYDPAEGVPQVVVKGGGAAAEELLRSRDALGGAPVVHDGPLAEQLYRLPMDAPIGPELYELVAALLAHVFFLEKETGETQPWTR